MANFPPPLSYESFPTGARETRVFVLVENRLLREALVRLLVKRGHLSVVGASGPSQGFSEVILEARPDVLVIDSQTLEVQGLDFIEAVPKQFSGVKPVLIGMEENTDTFLFVVRCGVVGYLLKDATVLDLVSAIRAVMLGEAVFPPRLVLSLSKSVLSEVLPRQIAPIDPEEHMVLHVPRAEVHEFSENLLGELRAEPAAIFGLTEDQFELLVCDRLRAMGMGVERVGSIYSSDGGIDVVAWPEKSATFPFLLAVQAKFHRRRNRKTGPNPVLELQSVVRNLPFQAGLLVTNTSFTPNAKWVASNSPHLVRLRDHEDLRRWILGNFLDETEWREIPEFLEYAPGKKLWLPRKSRQ